MDDDDDFDLLQASLAAEEKFAKQESFTQELQGSSNSGFDTEAHEKLKKYYGHVKFRPTAVIDKKDQLLVMATGYGKSVCYQLPAILSSGMCIVVSPLISLMEDQVQNLKMKGVNAAFLGSGQSKKMEVYQAIESGKCKLLYLTPEFIDNDEGMDKLATWHANLGLSLIAIDEAHCISQWGHDFRKSFRQLGQLRSSFQNVAFMAVTGTATPKVRQDIINNLHLKDCKTTCTSFDRPNLSLAVYQKGTNTVSDMKKILNKEGNFGGPTIIYCPTRKVTEETATAVANGLRLECTVYHAGMTPKARKESHEAFSKDRIQVMVATVAFGMGIDKPDIRQVVHYGAPKDIECYYQEIGRAGRDGLPSKCTVFYSNGDFTLNRALCGEIKEPTFHQHKMDMVQKLEMLFASTACRRKNLLSHFEGQTVNRMASESCCDNCIRALKMSGDEGGDNGGDKMVDCGKEAYMALAVVNNVFNSCFGSGAYIAFLLKKNDKRFYDKHKQNTLYGAGMHRHEKWWKAFFQILRCQGFTLDKNCHGNKFVMTLGITPVGKQWLSSNAKNPNPSLLIEPNKEMVDWDRKPQLNAVVQTSAQTNDSKKILGSTKLRSWKSLTERGMQYSSQKVDTGTCSNEEIVQADLYKVLGKVRQDIANGLDVAPYMVASNRALIDMAKKRPGSLQSLDGIEDLPEQNIRRSGQQFVAAIAQYCKQNDLVFDVILNSVKPDENGNVPEDISDLMDTLPHCVMETYRMAIKSPLTLVQLAQSRDRSEGTVLDHLASAVHIGLPLQLELYGITRDIVNKVHNVITRPPIFSDIKALKPIKEALPFTLNEHTYGQLRLIVSILEYEYGTNNADGSACSVMHKAPVPVKSESFGSDSAQGNRKVPAWMNGSDKGRVDPPPPKKAKSSLFSK